MSLKRLTVMKVHVATPDFCRFVASPRFSLHCICSGTWQRVEVSRALEAAEVVCDVHHIHGGIDLAIDSSDVVCYP